MKRIIITTLILAGFVIVQAQESAPTPTLNFNSLKKKFDKSNEDIQDEKAKLKANTWLKRGELLQDIHDVNTEFVRLGMPVSEAQLFLGDPDETKTNDEEQELHVYERITLIFEDGTLTDWIETERILDKPLPLALEAYNEALRLDEKGKLNDKVLEGLERLKRQAEDDAIRQFTKRVYDMALVKFELIMETSKSPVFEGYIDSVVIYNSALAARNAGMHEKAADYFKRATEINYGGSDAYYLLVREYYTLKDSLKALETLQQGFTLYPDTTIILFELVNYYIGTDNAEEGMKYLELAEEAESTNPSIYFAKGSLFDRMGDRDKAIEEYKKSLEVDPEYYNSWYNLGAAYFNNAVELYDEANAKQDLDEYNKAKTVADDELKKAIDPMLKATEIMPAEVDPLETLKTIYYRLQMEEEYNQVIEQINNIQ